MKNQSTYDKRLAALLKQVAKKYPSKPSTLEDPVGQMIIAFLQWNTTTKQAAKAYAQIMASMVDYNDLRVSYPEEVLAVIGERYPQGHDRAQRIRQSLQEVYQRQRAMSLDHLTAKPKKQARAYLDSLPGMVPYVAAQVTLVCFGGHAIPVDDLLVSMLRGHDAIDPQTPPETIEAYLQRRIKASEAAGVHSAFRAWVDDNPGKVDIGKGAAKKKGASEKPKKTRAVAKKSSVKVVKKAPKKSDRKSTAR